MARKTHTGFFILRALSRPSSDSVAHSGTCYAGPMCEAGAGLSTSCLHSRLGKIGAQTRTVVIVMATSARTRRDGSVKNVQIVGDLLLVFRAQIADRRGIVKGPTRIRFDTLAYGCAPC